VKLLIGLLIGASLATAVAVRVAAQPDLKGSGFLSGWSVVVQRQVACYNPLVNEKERTVTCP
jgi:hypothetical protein